MALPGVPLYADVDRREHRRDSYSTRLRHAYETRKLIGTVQVPDGRRQQFLRVVTGADIGVANRPAREGANVVDAGLKAYAIDAGLPRVWQRELELYNFGDEHGILRLSSNASAAELPLLGETVWLVPGHCDPTVNLHDAYVAVRGGLERGVVEALWPVDTRGCLL